jgi:subtilisin family serine protease
MFHVPTAGRACMLALGLYAHAAIGLQPPASEGLYIVVLREPPAERSSVRAKQATLVAGVGARKAYDYTHALNGFAAPLTASQLRALRADPAVKGVYKNEVLRLDTVSTPRFLELSAANGPWAQAGGAPHAGDGVIVGVIDTGIWPEHPSFAARPQHAGAPGDWRGRCETGESFSAAHCNEKLIGARWFGAGFGGDEAIRRLFPYEFVSARAADGHGVHTAAIAVGNHRVEARTAGIGFGYVSGMAPGARLAVYKACWGHADDPSAGCTIADSIAAIDQAVADGVDILNFSVSGAQKGAGTPIELALLAAAEAGVFVSTTAGNDGEQGPGTVAHASPWVTTVAMGTHDRRFEAAVVFGTGPRFKGVTLHDRGNAERAVVLAAEAAVAGVERERATFCLPGTLDPARVSGNTIVCDRGLNARTEKSRAIADAGGAGMILVNVAPDTLDADLHSVPTIHVDEVTGVAIKRLVSQRPGIRAAFTERRLVTGAAVAAPLVASASGRGPGGGDLLKPDLLAPGTAILAAYSPARTGHDFAFLAGTSMAGAHVAGIAALVKQKHPDWSPAAIRSALMTTATPRGNDARWIHDASGGGRADPFAFGAGLVRPEKALDPGLVYDSGSRQWRAFLCAGEAGCPLQAQRWAAGDINQPAIAVGKFVGRQTVRRTVTHVGEHAAEYSVAIHAPPGIRVEVSPREFTLAPGASRTFTVRFTRREASLGRYVFGSLVWSDGAHAVRSPIALQPSALAAPGAVSGQGNTIRYQVRFGYDGRFSARARGLVPARRHTRTVVDDPADDINVALASGSGVALVEVDVAPHSRMARFSLFDVDTAGRDDLDLYVFDPHGAFVAASNRAGANETVDLRAPTAGKYIAVVHALRTAGPDTRFTLSSWVLGDADSGNVSVDAPVRGAIGSSGTVGLRFRGLRAGVRYLGAVAYGGSPSMPEPTLLSVEPPIPKRRDGLRP